MTGRIAQFLAGLASGLVLFAGLALAAIQLERSGAATAVFRYVGF